MSTYVMSIVFNFFSLIACLECSAVSGAWTGLVYGDGYFDREVNFTNSLNCSVWIPTLLAPPIDERWKYFGCKVDTSIPVLESENMIKNILTVTGLNLTRVTVTRTSIRQVPGNVCGLRRLQDLDLSRNHLSTVSPADCFHDMIVLRSLDLSNNRITNLPSGIFKNLRLLEYLNINDNQMTSLDPGIFPSVPYKELRALDVSRNQLTSLDIWPLGLMCQDCTVYLRNNNITQFTNLDNSTYSCGASEISMILDMSDNDIPRFSDLIEGWGFESPEDFLCLFQGNTRNTFKMILSSETMLCDCLDFKFIESIQRNAYSLDLTRAECFAPRTRTCRRVLEVPLDDLICQVSANCPDKCKCTDQPSTMTMIVNCTNAGLIALPGALPPLKDTRYKYHLIAAKNKLRRLNYVDYLENTRILDVSDSNVEEIDGKIWDAFGKMVKVYLSNNLLTRLPNPSGHLMGISSSFRGELDIQNNPIACNCTNEGIKSWLEQMGDRIVNPTGINCNSPEWLKGKSVILLKNEEFCAARPVSEAAIKMMIIPAVVGITLMYVIVHVCLLKFRHLIFKYTSFHPFDRDECKGEDMNHDAFLAYSSADINTAEALITKLESRGFKVCHHERDFTPGVTINENIISAIDKSKRVLCLVTQNFSLSKFCMDEFTRALHRDTVKGKRRTVMLLQESIGHFEGEETPVGLRDYLHRFTCIEMGNRGWEDQLMYAMPVNKLSSCDETVDDRFPLVGDTVIYRGPLNDCSVHV